MDEVADRVPARQKAQLHEVADGLLQVYRTLARMQYLDPSWIHTGPHDMTLLLPVCRELAIDDAVIYLYGILPYVDAAGDRGVDFYRGGDFIDFRGEDEIRRGRDPMYADDEEQVMRPWMTPLSSVGNHCTALIYDARKHVLGIFGQMDSGSSDPNLHEGWTTITDGEEMVQNGADDEVENSRDGSKDGDEDEAKSEEGEDGECEDEDEDEDEGDKEDESEENDDNDDDDDNINHWDEMDSRPAPNVLRDMVLWYENLTELPGSGERSGPEWDAELTKPLYVKHGWPGADFDGEAFLVDQARAVAAASAKSRADEPLKKLSDLQSSILTDDSPGMQWHRDAIAGAPNPDREKLPAAQAEVDRLCPGGQSQNPDELPLWELPLLRDELRFTQRSLARLQQELKESEEGEGSGGGAAETHHRIAFAEKMTRIHQMAFDACEADVERMCPGKYLPTESDEESPAATPVEKREEHASAARDVESDMGLLREWLGQVPEEAHGARQAAQHQLETMERKLEYSRVQCREIAAKLEGQASAEAA
ncbi:hypothetical protein ACHAQA_008149 [Verticillium albo-atrum]